MYEGLRLGSSTLPSQPSVCTYHTPWAAPRPQRRVLAQPVSAGLGDAIRDLFDFESWAPRSSQAWRMGQQPAPRAGAAGSISDADVEVLNLRLAQARASSSSLESIAEEEEEEFRRGARQEEPASPFLSSTDGDFASALSARIGQVATGAGPAEGDGGGALDGRALRELILLKYGKQHDVAFVRRDVPGKTLISMNIYHAHLSQRSFPMTREAYEEKVDGVATLLEAWGQAARVAAFLREPVAPRRGLPSRPVVGSAVSVALELAPAQVEEWFGR